jgi:hypothetical protein
MSDPNYKATWRGEEVEVEFSQYVDVTGVERTHITRIKILGVDLTHANLPKRLTDTLEDLSKHIDEDEWSKEVW